jgi:hypothetical protein
MLSIFHEQKFQLKRFYTNRPKLKNDFHQIFCSDFLALLCELEDHKMDEEDRLQRKLQDAVTAMLEKVRFLLDSFC